MKIVSPNKKETKVSLYSFLSLMLIPVFSSINQWLTRPVSLTENMIILPIFGFYILVQTIHLVKELKLKVDKQL